jgi:predicted dehydrogenase
MIGLKIAIVGAGVWGENHASIYNENRDVELVAVCDANIKKAEALAARFGVKGVYSDHREMLKGSDCDAVSIVTPDFLHGDIAVDCANAKRHMLIEKPLATTREDVLRIVEAVERNKVRVMVDLHNRWNPPFAAAKKAIEDNELGEPYSAYFRLNDAKWVATDMLSWAQKSSIIWFLGTHSLDTLRWMFDDEAERIYSVSREGVLKDLGVQTVDIYQTTIEFKKGGIAQMENGWITPNANTCVNDIKFNILGTKGMISIDASSHNLIQKVTDEKVETPDILVKNFIHGKAKGFAYESIAHFVEKMISGEEFLVSIEDAAMTSLALITLMESAKTRKPIKVEY